MIIPVKGRAPEIDPSAFVADSAALIGDVVLGRGASVWFGAVVRGDSNSIRIGALANIQDNSVLHVDHTHKLAVGDEVTIGHRAILHGCTICDRVLVGMGATIMNGAVIGSDSIVGAGALVTENTRVPPRSLILGVPAKVKRELTDDEAASIRRSATLYSEYAGWYTT